MASQVPHISQFTPALPAAAVSFAVRMLTKFRFCSLSSRLAVAEICFSIAFPNCLRGQIHCSHPRILRISQSIKEMNWRSQGWMTWHRYQFSFVTSQRFQAVRISTRVLESGASQRSRDGLFSFVGSSQRGYRPNYRWKTTARGFFFSCRWSL